MKKKIALLMTAVMLFGATVGATIAWLQAETAPVTNTFTVGDINIELKEHNYDPSSKMLTSAEVTSEGDYKIIPGTNLPKDPFVRVKAESEACWVFVKVEADKWPTANVTYAIDDSKWTELGATSYPGIYYYKQDSLVDATDDVIRYILKDNQVVVSGDLTKSEIEDIKAAGTPTLKFTAYAVQAENFATAQAAWDATFGL